MSNGKLVLTRKPGESIKIGESLLITVTICSITKGIVKFLFEADKRIRIVRTEIAA